MNAALPGAGSGERATNGGLPVAGKTSLPGALLPERGARAPWGGDPDPDATGDAARPATATFANMLGTLVREDGDTPATPNRSRGTAADRLQGSAAQGPGRTQGEAVAHARMAQAHDSRVGVDAPDAVDRVTAGVDADPVATPDTRIDADGPAVRRPLDASLAAIPVAAVRADGRASALSVDPGRTKVDASVSAPGGTAATAARPDTSATPAVPASQRAIGPASSAPVDDSTVDGGSRLPGIGLVRGSVAIAQAGTGPQMARPVTSGAAAPPVGAEAVNGEAGIATTVGVTDGSVGDTQVAARTRSVLARHDAAQQARGGGHATIGGGAATAAARTSAPTSTPAASSAATRVATDASEPLETPADVPVDASNEPVAPGADPVTRTARRGSGADAAGVATAAIRVDASGGAIDNAAPALSVGSASAPSAPLGAPAVATMPQGDATAFQARGEPLFLQTASAPAALAETVRMTLADGRNAARVDLSPVELGALSIELEQQQDGRLTVSLHSASAATRDLIEALAPRLREQLGADGHTSVEVDVGDRDGGASQEGGGDDLDARHEREAERFAGGERPDGVATRERPLIVSLDGEAGPEDGALRALPNDLSAIDDASVRTRTPAALLARALGTEAPRPLLDSWL